MKIGYKFEVFFGAAILFMTLMFCIKIYSVASVSKYKHNSIQVYASFNNIDGIDVGSDVKIGGMKIGVVTAMKIDENYNVVLSLGVDEKIKIPSDSKAIVSTSGLLGGKYIAIEPGGEIEYMKSGSTFDLTQSSLSLESLIGKFAFGGGDKKDKE